MIASVIVCVYNRGKQVQACLDSLLAMQMQLTTDSWAFLSLVAFWRRDFCSMALTGSAVCRS